MKQIVIIGFVAGSAAALLYGSLATGSLGAMPLFYLAPLPILIAALAWSHWAALIGTLAATAGLAAVNLEFAFVFVLGIGLPAWWLGYLALLARPGATPHEHDWYPVGRLVLWTACIGALLATATMLNFTADSGLREALRDALTNALDVNTDPAQREAIARTVDVVLQIAPAALAAAMTLTSVLNLWLAGRIAKISGRLRRPWPSLPDTQFPILAPAALGAAVTGAFLPGVVGLSLQALSASLIVAHALLGLAVIHALTIGHAGRGFVLGSVYAAIVLSLSHWLIGWLLPLIALIGAADALFDLRHRVARMRGPPAPRT